MILVVFSQFWPKVWGFKVAASQKASRRMIGICVAGLSVPFLLFLFATFGDDKMRTQWQYLDVVCQMPLIAVVGILPHNSTIVIRRGEFENLPHNHQVSATNVSQLQTEKHCWLEY